MSSTTSHTNSPTKRPASEKSLKDLQTYGKCDPMFPCGEGCGHLTAALQLHGVLPIYEEIDGKSVECYANITSK